MIGLLVLFFIGKWHYALAETHKKNKWLFAILGVVCYYIGMFVGGLFIGVLAVMLEWNAILELPDVAYGLIGLPFGLAATWGLHTILRKNWEKNPVRDNSLLDEEI